MERRRQKEREIRETEKRKSARERDEDTGEFKKGKEDHFSILFSVRHIVQLC